MTDRRHNPLNAGRRRRGTILVMVVTVLALLFVIVSGFLASARIEEQLSADLRRGDVTKAIVDGVEEMAEAAVLDQLAGDDGQVMSGDQGESWQTIPGFRGSSFLASATPVLDESRTDPPLAANASNLIAWLDKVTWPAVTTLGGSDRPIARTLVDLLAEYELDTTESALLDIDNINFFDLADLQVNALAAMNDADGDGVPDSDIILSRPATLLANQMTGGSTSLPGPGALSSGFGISRMRSPRVALGAPGTPARQRYEAEQDWRRFLQDVRYTVAPRVVSHGGMLPLDAAPLEVAGGTQEPWYRRSLVTWFNAIGNPNDAGFGAAGLLPNPATTAGRRQLDELFSEIVEVRGPFEAALRSRFVLPLPARGDGSVAQPAILSAMEDRIAQGTANPFRNFRLPETFAVSMRGRSNLESPAERINLGDSDFRREQARDGSEAATWVDMVQMRPVWANNTIGGLPGRAPPRATSGYEEAWTSRRPVLTTTNYSDEIAQKYDVAEPVNPLPANPAAAPVPGDPMSGELRDGDLRLYRGEPKFFLGDIEKAFTNVGGQWRYEHDPVTRNADGDKLVRKLARHFGELLSAYGHFNNFPVTKREQAFMLAVNTLAFASPRDPVGTAQAGWIDPVVFTETDPVSLTTRTYVGYAPQPFISEAMAIRVIKEDYDDAGEPTVADRELSVAVELYNPHDPGVDYALNLAQYQVSITTTGPNGTNTSVSSGRLDTLLGATQFPGREFAALAFEYVNATDSDLSNRYFTDRLAVPANAIIPMSNPLSLGNGETHVRVRLQRYKRNYQTGLLEGPYTVDEVVLEVPDATGSTPNFGWRSIARDTSPTVLFNGAPGSGLEPARWSVVTAAHHYDGGGTLDDDDVVPGSGGSGQRTFAYGSDSAGHRDPLQTYLGPLSPFGSPNWLTTQNGVTDPDGPPTVAPSAPVVPLITMNADPRLRVYMYGNPYDPRPASFPTVGFMLYLPRYAHISRNGSVETVGSLLHEELRSAARGGQWPSDVAVPVDFGHVPSIDNTHGPISTTITQATDTIPWALSFFDFFTTLDPGTPGYDPRRVSGRIDINNAPWWVLAQAPMIGPMNGGQPQAGELPIRWYAPTERDGSLAQFEGGATVGINPSWGAARSFWDPDLGVVVGANVFGYPRSFAVAPTSAGGGLPPAQAGAGEERPRPQDVNGRYVVGNWLAQAACAYRDGVQNLPSGTNFSGQFWYPYAAAASRNRPRANYGAGVNQADIFDWMPYRQTSTVSGASAGVSYYGRMRGDRTPGRDAQYGFLSIGELLNVRGWDATEPFNLSISLIGPSPTTAGPGTVGGAAGYSTGDFVRAVSLVAQLDSQYLTTRSNTFTIYTSVIDRTDGGQSRSVRSQKTIDRGNTLPLVQMEEKDSLTGAIVPYQPRLRTLPNGRVTPIRVTNDGGRPTLIAERRESYFDTSGR